jgi:hypothetical protein
MEFCKSCKNMLYIFSTNEGLNKTCKHCEITENIVSGEAIKLSETIYTNDSLLFEKNKNIYIREDPTLRRIVDPNLNNGKPTLFIKYNPTDVNFMYVSEDNGEIWKNEKK